MKAVTTRLCQISEKFSNTLITRVTRPSSIRGWPRYLLHNTKTRTNMATLAAQKTAWGEYTTESGLNLETIMFAKNKNRTTVLTASSTLPRQHESVTGSTSLTLRRLKRDRIQLNDEMQFILVYESKRAGRPWENSRRPGWKIGQPMNGKVDGSKVYSAQGGQGVLGYHYELVQSP